MSLFSKKPHGLLRLVFHLPILLYRLHLGWLLGQRFLLVTHTGRKSGARRQTVIEVVNHDKTADVYYVVSGFGHQADWFLNIQKNPNVSITIGCCTFAARARTVIESDAAKILLNYAKEHPLAFKELSRILLGEVIQPTIENCTHFVQSMPMISFLPSRK